MTIILELPIDIQDGLRILANEYGESYEEIVIGALRDYLEQAKQHRMKPEQWAIEKLQRPTNDAPTSGEISDADWKSISRGVVSDNRELLDRLAK